LFFPKDPNIIGGLPSKLYFLGENDKSELDQIFTHTKVDNGNGVDSHEEIKLNYFPVGSVLIFEAELPDRAKEAIEKLGELIVSSISFFFFFLPLSPHLPSSPSLSPSPSPSPLHLSSFTFTFSLSLSFHFLLFLLLTSLLLLVPLLLLLLLIFF
jgi:hypothetical protein